MSGHEDMASIVSVHVGLHRDSARAYSGSAEPAYSTVASGAFFSDEEEEDSSAIGR